MACQQQHKNYTILLTHKMDEPMLRYLRFLKGEITEVMDFYILWCHIFSVSHDPGSVGRIADSWKPY